MMRWVRTGVNCPSCGAEVLQETLMIRTSIGTVERVDGRQLKCESGCRIVRGFNGRLMTPAEQGEYLPWS